MALPSEGPCVRSVLLACAGPTPFSMEVIDGLWMVGHKRPGVYGLDVSKASEVPLVEGQNAFDAAHVHGRHQRIVAIVRLDPSKQNITVD